jgi:hypothetical protein
MIRQQQQQLQQAQLASGLLPSNPSYSAVDDSTPTSERSFSFPNSQLTTTVTNPRPRSPTSQSQSRASVDLSRQSPRRSRTSSRSTSSPSLLPLSAGLGFHGDGSEHGWVLGGSRDESAFYQAETQMLTRENQMLRQRIRELGMWTCIGKIFRKLMRLISGCQCRASGERTRRQRCQFCSSLESNGIISFPRPHSCC